MPEGNHNIDFNHLHEKVLYVMAEDERKDTVSLVFYVGWIASGLVILFLALMYGRDAAMMALLAAGVAGSILWLINTGWKRRLLMKYSTDKQGQQ